VEAATTVAVLVAKVCRLDDPMEPARGAGAGVVVRAPDTTESVDAETKRVPPPGRDATQVATLGPDVIGATAFAASFEARAISTDQGVGAPKVLTQAKVEASGEVKGEARKPVVRIVPRGLQLDDRSHVVGAPVFITVTQPANGPSSRNVKRTVRMEGKVHDVGEPLVENHVSIRPPVAIGIVKPKDPVGRRPGVTVRAEVRVTFGNKDTASRVDGESGGGNHEWLGGKEGNHDARISRDRGVLVQRGILRSRFRREDDP